jgi:hypothetical protein
MKSKNILYCFFLCFVILAFSYYNSQYNKSLERFTPKIREIYRPYVRNARMLYTNYYDKVTNKISNILKKNEIL